MRHIYIKITAYVLALVLISGSFFTALSLTADAKASRDLYGTGSADDIDITKLLDMALNKGGMSMSPSTIKAFLEYWWDSVASDLNTCIGNASSALTTTKDFAEYIISALDNAEHYDRLGEMMKRYVQYVLTLDYKSLSDFKQLLTQEGTFRKFLLSYVVDEDGNIANTVNNKLKKYSLKSGLVNMVREAADAYIEEYEGYYLVKTHTPSDISPTAFNDKRYYNSILKSLSGLTADTIIYSVMSYRSGNNYYNFYDVSDLNFVLYGNKSGSSYICDNSLMDGANVSVYDNNWSNYKVAPYLSFGYIYNLSTGTSDFSGDDFTATDIKSSDKTVTLYLYLSTLDVPYYNTELGWIYTKDGRFVKVWKSLDTFKKYSVGKSNIYYSNTYSSFDNSVDNSVTFTGQYYTSNEYSHTTIQNNIDNSQEINETIVNNIVNNYITNNYYGTDNSGDDVSGDDSSISEFLTSLVDGLAALVESVGKLLDGIENLFMKLFVPSEGFADPIKEKINTKFYFVEETHSDILGLVDRFDTMGKTPPTITFPFSKTILSKYGVSDITVSFEWFEPYRVGFQLLISAIMWAMFLFSQFFGLKNLIQGTDSAVRNITS